MRQIRFSILIVVVSFVALPLFAADYVLTAPKWGRAQAQAVRAAGGTVRYAHATGFAIVSADAADFASRVNASNAFSDVIPDIVAQWTASSQMADGQLVPDASGVGSYTAAQWALETVNAQGAWSAGYQGAGVRVAVIDGGIYDKHIDLNGNIDVARSVSFVPGVAFNHDVGTVWHATHVAGIIAAKNDGIGITGIAPRATIVGVKVLHGDGGSFGAVIAGIYYAATPLAEGGAGADIINMSLSAEFQRGRHHEDSLVAQFAKACNYAASKGVLVISAAGNNSRDLGQSRDLVTIPAESGSGLAISATGPLGFGRGATNFRRPAAYSNFGEGVIWLAGPGGDSDLPGGDTCTLAGIAPQPCWRFDRVVSTIRGSGDKVDAYAWAEGTSMAAPAVAGVAALAKQAHPGISLGALKTLIARSADDEGKIGRDEFYGNGYPNAGKAVR